MQKLKFLQAMNLQNIRPRLRKLGTIAFLFFLIKGLLWIASLLYVADFAFKAKSQAAPVIVDNTLISRQGKKDHSYKKRHLPLEVYLRKDAAPRIVVIAFVSINCGACGNFYINVLPKLIDKYVKTGKIKIVMYHFPLDIVSVLMEIIMAQLENKDIPYYKKLLYNNLDKWVPPFYADSPVVDEGKGNAPDIRDAEVVKQQNKAISMIVKMLNLSPAVVQKAINDDKYKDSIMEKAHDILNKHPKLEGTPHFVIARKDYGFKPANNAKIDKMPELELQGTNHDFMSFEDFAKVIDKELAALR